MNVLEELAVQVCEQAFDEKVEQMTQEMLAAKPPIVIGLRDMPNVCEVGDGQ